MTILFHVVVMDTRGLAKIKFQINVYYLINCCSILYLFEIKLIRLNLECENVIFFKLFTFVFDFKRKNWPSTFRTL